MQGRAIGAVEAEEEQAMTILDYLQIIGAPVLFFTGCWLFYVSFLEPRP